MTFFQQESTCSGKGKLSWTPSADAEYTTKTSETTSVTMKAGMESDNPKDVKAYTNQAQKMLQN